MKNFDTRTYSISDFVEWNKNGLLLLSPDFQRRSVWSDKAKSYLIDTILRGKPMPKIIITQELKGAKNIRVVVDGQQRLRAILEYFNGDFKISKAHNEKLSKFTFQTLHDEIKKEFLKYELGVDLLFDTPYQELLDIFARINSYTVKLVPQEIYNAKYLGFFKNKVYNLGYKYVNYYIEGGILTKANITRMAEAELTADLFVSLLDTVRTNKGIETYYKEYEDKQDNLEDISKKFDMVMSYIGSIYPASELRTTNYSRTTLFYTLFTSIAHLLYSLNGLDKKNKKTITEKSIGKLRVALDNISALYNEITGKIDDSLYPKDFKEFIHYTRRGSTDTNARIFRSNFLCKKIIGSL
jgi:hypothetical protein